MKFAPTPTAIRCPLCSQPVTVPLHRVIDALDQPDLKARLLSGRHNTFTCPNCRNTGSIAAPFIYHDGSKELALIFMPMNSGLNHTDEQRAIGQLTQAVMNSVPPEQRKAYLLQPQQFFTMQTLIDEVLKADGITPEMVKAQQAKVELLRRLLEAKDDTAFNAIALENDAQVDDTFFQLLSLVMANTEAENRPDEFNQAMSVRNRLLEVTSLGRKVRAQTEAIETLMKNPTREALLEQLSKAPDTETREALLAVSRPLLDYPFFQQLTGQIDAARNNGNKAEADRLTDLRKEVLALRDKLNAQAQQLFDQRATLLRELMVSDDLEGAARSQIGALDEVFFSVLTSEIQAAQQTGDAKTYERLRQVGNAAMKAIQEQQPPEIQFVNALLSVKYPDATRQLLERNRQALRPDFIEWLESVVVELRESGRAESAERLILVTAQAREMMGASVAK